MKIFKIKEKGVDFIQMIPFKIEKEIQVTIEKNCNEFFGLEFVRSEFTVGEFRIDSLCFNYETNSFVIIEYKKGNSYSVIDQGYSYLSIMLNHKSDFIIEYNERLNKNLRRDDIDWTQSKVIFVSQSFSTYQKNSVNFKNIPFELWEIKRFINDTILLNQIISSSKENIDTLGSSEKNSVLIDVSNEIKIFDEEYHTNKLDEDTKLKWEELKERVLGIDNISLQVMKPYISFSGQSKKICYCNFRKNYISIEILRGNTNTEGVKSKTFFTLDDPKKVSEEGYWEWKNGVKGHVYRIKFDKYSDVDYTMFLINQKVNSVI